MSVGNTASSSRRRARDWLGLSQQTLLLHLAVVVVVVVSSVAVAVIVADRSAHRAAEDQVLSVAQTVASMPEVALAFELEDPSSVLQPLAERARIAADVSFIVVMEVDGTRHSHPNPANIGGTFVGTIAPAAAGGVVTETFEGTLGPSVRAVVPIIPDGATEPVGLVSAGVLVDRVGDAVRRAIPVLVGGAAVAMLLAAGGSWLIARRLRRQTLGMGPRELAGLYAHHDAVLHAVREGLVVADPDRHLILINDEAQRLLGSDPPIGGGLEGSLADRVESGETVTDELHLVGDRLVVVSQVPVASRTGSGDSLGTVITMRDHTELMALTDELSATRSLADSLRAQAHESANRLHSVVTLVELGDTDAALQFATSQIRAVQDLTDSVVTAIREPTLAALLLGKASQAHERAVELIVGEGSSLGECGVDAADLVTIAGNLVDNAIDATLGAQPPRRVKITIEHHDDRLTIGVCDSGLGLSAEAAERLFEPGWSTKPVDAHHIHGRGIGMALVRQVVQRYGGTLDVEAQNPDDRDGYTGARITVRMPVSAGRVESDA